MRYVGGGGGLSEAVAVPYEAVLPLPDNVDLDIGGMYRCFPLQSSKQN